MLSYLLKIYLICSAVSASVLSEKEDSFGNDLGTEKRDARISGGVENEHRLDFRFQIQLFIGDDFCSGFIMNEFYLVTAAHCVDDVMTEDVFAMVGSDTFFEGKYLDIAEIVLHPEYEFPRQDVAYLRLFEPLDFYDFHRYPISHAYLEPVGTRLPHEAAVSGWRLGDSEEVSDTLMYVNLTIISQRRCQLMYPEVKITNNMICAENTRHGGEGACRGDGGAPLSSYTGPYDYRRIIGISSFTRGCGPDMGPSVFTYIEAREIYDFLVEGTRLDDDTDFYDYYRT